MLYGEVALFFLSGERHWFQHAQIYLKKITYVVTTVSLFYRWYNIFHCPWLQFFDLGLLGTDHWPVQREVSKLLLGQYATTNKFEDSRRVDELARWLLDKKINKALHRPWLFHVRQGMEFSAQIFAKPSCRFRRGRLAKWFLIRDFWSKLSQI